jgi:thiol-disulfide isomerase/thioredoxin
MRSSLHLPALLLACCALAWPLAGRAGGPAVGKPAPPLSLHTLDGRTIATDSLRGQVVILTFWATWCGPCKAELPLLSAYAAKHADEGLTVLGFSLDQPDQLDVVRTMAGALSFPSGLLGEPWVPGYGRIWKLPVNFTIDRRGILADNSWNDERPDWTAERLERIVTPLLGRPRQGLPTQY